MLAGLCILTAVYATVRWWRALFDGDRGVAGMGGGDAGGVARAGGGEPGGGADGG
jgi:hypothetical protein